MSDQCRHCTMKGKLNECRQTPCFLHENWSAIQLQEENKRLRECLDMALEWIDAVPSATVLPAMPGFDRDCVEDVRSGYSGCETEKAQDNIIHIGQKKDGSGTGEGMTALELDKISTWMGKPCACVETGSFGNDDEPMRYWGSCAQHSDGGNSIPWDVSNSRAVELLLALREKGFWYRMEATDIGTYFGIYRKGCKMFIMPVASDEASAIPEAVSAAVLELIEQEAA